MALWQETFTSELLLASTISMSPRNLLRGTSSVAKRFDAADCFQHSEISIIRLGKNMFELSLLTPDARKMNADPLL